jgi:NAD(P)-dependent dehydrogenase (short-subunit alcohol dehydrogenase family)
MKTFKNKVAAITGAASGIGRALAIELANHGAHVALADVNQAGLAETASLIRGQRRVSQHIVNVGERVSVEGFAAEVARQHGGADLIFNNAGIAVLASLEDVSYDEFEHVINVNLWGVVYGTKAFLPLLKQRPEGHIINISSINGMVPFANNGPYNISKYAVLGLNETLMIELRGTNVGITSVHPGGIKTNIVRNSLRTSAADASNFDRIAMTTPAQAAKTILAGVRKKQERVYIGMDAKIMAMAKRILPAGTVQLVGTASAQAAKRRKSRNLERKV